MTVTIRPVARDDRARWEELFRSYAAFYKVDIADAAVDAVWDWIHDGKAEFFGDLAVSAEDGATVGLVHYWPMFRPLAGKRTCYLSDLYVDPAIRGQGAGRALIDHVRAYAAREGLSDVRWLTQEFNYAARRLYDSYAPKSDFIMYSVTPG